MCLTEYNEAETMQMFKEEGRKEGKIEGKILARYEDGMAVEDIAVKTRQTVDFVNGTLKANGLL